MTEHSDVHWVDLPEDSQPSKGSKVKQSPRARELAASSGPALGSDPFAEVVDEDPFLRELAAMESPLDAASAATPTAAAAALPAPAELAPPSATPSVEPMAAPARTAPVGSQAAATTGPRPVAASPRGSARSAAQTEPTPLQRPRHSTRMPTLAEIELPEPDGWIERLLDPEDRRRLAALTHLVESDSSYDRFGMSPDVLRRTFPAFYALYKLYFRVFSEGHGNIPTTGPAVLACNHAGLLPFDGAMIVIDAVLNTDPPRLPRAIVDFWAGSLPWVNVFFARVGQVIGTRENFADLLGDDQLMLVFPEGMAGVRKPITQRYRLQHFHVGFVEQALLAGAPIVPMAVIGSDDQAPILYDLEPIAKQLGLPSLPITPTFPLLGPLGLLPYPVGYHIVYGEPFDFHERFGPEEAKDPKLVSYLAKRVRRAIQQLVDKNR